MMLSLRLLLSVRPDVVIDATVVGVAAVVVI